MAEPKKTITTRTEQHKRVVAEDSRAEQTPDVQEITARRKRSRKPGRAPDPNQD